MATPKERQLKALRDAEAKLANLDDATAGRIANMYDAVRRDLLSALMGWYQQMGEPDTADELRIVANQVYRIKEIERAIRALSVDIADYLQDQLPRAWEIGLENADRDLVNMARVLREDLSKERLFAGLDKQLPLTVEAFINRIPGIVQPLAAQLTSELQYSLTQGDSFTQIVQRLIGADLGPSGASFFRRGALSMELFSRRAVVDANNASRQIVYENAKTLVNGLKKQAIAAIDDRTTECCLSVHGQVADVGQTYKLTGTPRFQDEMMFPAFHWRCRTSSAAYHIAYEVAAEGTEASTAYMREQARQALKARQADSGGG